MAYSTSLYMVRGVFYFRCRIPADIRQHFDGKEDFKRSLRTKNLTMARRLLKFANARTEQTFIMIRSGMLTPEQIKILAERWKHNALNNSDNNRLLWHDYPDSRAELQSRIEVEEMMERQAKDALIFNKFNPVQSSIVDDVVKKRNLDVEKDSPEYIQLARALMQKLIEVCQIEQARMKGNHKNGYDDRIERVLLHSIPDESEIIPDKPAPRLAEAISKYIGDLANKGRASKNSIDEYAGCCRLFVNVLGNVEVRTITRDNIRHFHEILRKLPSNMNKKLAYKGKSIPELLKMDIPAADLLSETSIKKYADKINSLCMWCVREEWMEKNPAEGLTIAKKKRIKASEERSAYSKEDLKKMVIGYNKVAAEGELTGKPERLWLPLVSLFSGLRLNEVAQLHVNDIQQEGDIWFFNIEGDDSGTKRVKSTSSKREVPIHPQLIDIGFMDYYRHVKESGSPRLWMQLSQSARGKYARNFSNWFLGHGYPGFKRCYINPDSLLNFHSFRHTFIDGLKQMLIDRTIVEEIAGHAHGSLSFDRYGKALALKTRLEAMLKLDYGVDFSSVKEIAKII